MSQFFDNIQSQILVDAIGRVEKHTDGELRIHIEDFCDIDAVDRAKEVFYKLKMNLTQNKTGVLIYIASEDRKIAIIGDEGINEKVSPYFWDSIIKDIVKEFSHARYLEGLLDGIEKVSKVLIEHFPSKEHNPNELSNEISYGKL